MGRWGNNPTTIADLRSFDISFLRKHEYIKPDQFKTGSIIWTSGHGTKNSISIKTVIGDTNGVLTVDYTFRNTEKINYDIELITRPSNLGTGLLWFFVCPFTGKVCRKLHLINGYFKHRYALPGLMYQNQIESKKWREWKRIFAKDFNDDVYTELYSKNFKRYYNGKMTKRFARISKKLQEIENADPNDYLKILKAVNLKY